MVKATTGDFGDNRFPLEAYNEMRRWLATWVNQELDPDKRLAAFIAREPQFTKALCLNKYSIVATIVQSQSQ